MTEHDSLTQDDRMRLTTIMETVDDGPRLAELIYDFYCDTDRADRTSRSQMYLHMGMLAGAIIKQHATATTTLPRTTPGRSSLDVVGTEGGKASTETRRS